MDSTSTTASSTSNIDGILTTAAATSHTLNKKLPQASGATDPVPKFSKDPSAQESWRGVYLRGVPANTTEQDLYDIFSCCGKITNIRIPQSKLYTTNAAYVDFETFESTAEALRLFGAAEGAAPKTEAGEGGKGAAAPSKRGKSARQKKNDYHRNQLAEHQKDGMVPRLVIRGVGVPVFPKVPRAVRAGVISTTTVPAVGNASCSPATAAAAAGAAAGGGAAAATATAGEVQPLFAALQPIKCC